MDSKKLEYLLKIAETRSVTEASKQLFISQPALSQVIGAMEKRYDIKIFEKKEGSLHLTPEGSILVDAARRQFFIEQNLELELADRRNQISGDISIGLSPSRSLHFLPLLLPQMQKEFPKVRIVINTQSSTGFEKMVAHGKLDFAFVMDLADIDPSIRNELTYEPLFSYNTLLAAPPNHSLAREAAGVFDWRKRRPVSLDEVRDEPFIVSPPRPRYRKWTDLVYKAYDFIPKEAVVISGSTAIHLVQAGVGFMLTQDSTAFSMKKGAFFRLDKGDFATNLCIIYRRDKYLTKPMRAFIDLVKYHNELGTWCSL